MDSAPVDLSRWFVCGVVTLREGRIVVAPTPRPDIAGAVSEAGGRVVELPSAEAIVWTGDAPDLLRESLHAAIRWVQLCASGVDSWVEPGVVDRDRVWTAAKGVAAKSIAEHIVCLMLAAARDLPRRIRATSWGLQAGRQLAGTTAGIIGCGGIGAALVDLLQPFDVATVAVTRTGRSVDGASRSVGPKTLHSVLAQSDWVILSAPATPRTHRMIDERAIGHMRPDAWIVNVSRGSLVDTDALVEALREGRIGGAALDVTDPEPLPLEHPLWQMPNVIITPHVATTPSMHASALCNRIRENVSRYRSGDDLIGVIDLDEGY
jgi:phosphoglycerate dehydrogenase-like enzyme